MSLLLIIYIIATIFFIASVLLEGKIAVWELLIALVILAVPYLNAIAFIVNFVMVLDHRGVINLRGIGESIVKFLNLRIK